MNLKEYVDNYEYFNELSRAGCEYTDRLVAIIEVRIHCSHDTSWMPVVEYIVRDEINNNETTFPATEYSAAMRLFENIWSIYDENYNKTET